MAKTKKRLNLKIYPGVSPQAVGLAVIFSFGAKNESKKTGGFTHLAEHAIFQGTKKLPSVNKVDQEIERITFDLEARVAREYLKIFSTFPKEYFHAVIDLLEQLIFFPLFAPENELAVKKEVLAELKKSRTDKMESFITEGAKKIFKGTGLENDGLGTVKNVKQSNIRQWRKWWYGKVLHSKFSIIAVGKLTDKEKTDLHQRFANRKCAVPPVSKSNISEQRIFVSDNSLFSYLYLKPNKGIKKLNSEVVRDIIGQRMPKKYGSKIKAGCALFKSFELIECQGVLPTASRRLEFLDMLKDIFCSPPTKKEIERAKQSVIKELQDISCHLDELLDWYIRSYFYSIEGGDKDINEQIRQVRRISEREVKTFFRRIEKTKFRVVSI